MYANLLIQHVWLGFTAGIVSREEMIANLRFLFASPKIRAFWRDTADSRHSIYVENTGETTLAAIADEIWREYEELLACSTEPGSDRQPAICEVRAGLRPRPGKCPW